MIWIIVDYYYNSISSVYYNSSISTNMFLGGEVDLARQCIKSVISGNYHSLLEHGAQVQDKGNQQGENNRKCQHEKHTALSETYLPGKSSCQVSFFLGRFMSIFLLSAEKSITFGFFILIIV